MLNYAKLHRKQIWCFKRINKIKSVSLLEKTKSTVQAVKKYKICLMF